MNNHLLAAGAAQDMLIVLAILVGLLGLFLTIRYLSNHGKRLLTRIYSAFQRYDSQQETSEHDNRIEFTTKKPHDFLPSA